MSFLFILFLFVVVWLFYPLKEGYVPSFTNYGTLNSDIDIFFTRMQNSASEYDTIFKGLTKK